MMNSTEENRLLYSSPDNSPELDSDRAKVLNQWLNYIPPVARCLDVGCGRGDFLALLSEKTEKWGIDFERHPQLDQQVRFFQGDIAQEWQVPVDYFDLIFAGEVIEHLLDTDLFLQRCHISLKTGGYLFLTTPNLSSLANLRYWLQTDQFMWVDSAAHQFGHVRYLAPKRMKRALENNGFDDVVMQSVAGLESLQKIPYLRNFIQSVFPLRGNRLCVMVHKIH